MPPTHAKPRGQHFAGNLDRDDSHGHDDHHHRCACRRSPDEGRRTMEALHVSKGHHRGVHANDHPESIPHLEYLLDNTLLDSLQSPELYVQPPSCRVHRRIGCSLEVDGSHIHSRSTGMKAGDCPSRWNRSLIGGWALLLYVRTTQLLLSCECPRVGTSMAYGLDCRAGL